jgi:hypothetical protein
MLVGKLLPRRDSVSRSQILRVASAKRGIEWICVIVIAIMEPDLYLPPQLSLRGVSFKVRPLPNSRE